MEAFKEGGFYEMTHLCDIYAFDDEKLGIYSYSSTNIIDYNIKSVHGPFKVKEGLIRKRYDDDEDDAEFQKEKGYTKDTAVNESLNYNIEFVEIENSADCYILESTEEVLDEYIIELDVQYSTILGNTKRTLFEAAVLIFCAFFSNAHL